MRSNKPRRELIKWFYVADSDLTVQFIKSAYGDLYDRVQANVAVQLHRGLDDQISIGILGDLHAITKITNKSIDGA